MKKKNPRIKQKEKEIRKFKPRRTTRDCNGESDKTQSFFGNQEILASNETKGTTILKKNIRKQNTESDSINVWVRNKLRVWK